MEGKEGVVGFMLRINRAGGVTQCTVTVSSGTKELDDATCANVSARGLFKPALDRKGHPIEDIYSSRVNWRIPGASAVNAGPASLPVIPPTGSALLSFTVEADGTMTGCHSDVVGGFQTGRRPFSCENIPTRFQPARDASGKAIAQKVTMEMTIEAEPVVAPAP